MMLRTAGLVASLLCSQFFATTARAVEVVFDDPDLEAAIREELSIPLGAITSEQMSTLTQLQAFQVGNGIGSLQGLQYAVNLQQLMVRNPGMAEKISDLSPVASLTSLQSLDVSGNAITSIDQIAMLSQLTGLGLEDNQLTDISLLSDFPDLQWVHLSGNAINDIDPLAGAPLDTLLINDCQVTSLTPLSGNTTLRILWAARNSISDLTPLASATQMEVLLLDENGITDITALQQMTALQHLALNLNSVSSIAPLTGLTEMRLLELEGNSLSDITSLQNLTKLENLSLAENSISDISVLQGMTQLQGLQLQGNAITSITPLQGLQNLHYLLLSENPLSDISPLQGLTALHTLELKSTGTTDANPLSSLTALTRLDLSTNGITDLGPLSAMSAMTSLYIFENEITDISPLGGMTQMTQLDLGENRISNLAPLAAMTQMTYLDLGRNSIADLSPLTAMTGITYLELSGNVITSIEPLSSMDNLREVYLSVNWIEDTTPLQDKTQLETLGITTNPLNSTSVDFLQSLPDGVANYDGFRYWNFWAGSSLFMQTEPGMRAADQYVPIVLSYPKRGYFRLTSSEPWVVVPSGRLVGDAYYGGSTTGVTVSFAGSENLPPGQHDATITLTDAGDYGTTQFLLVTLYVEGPTPDAPTNVRATAGADNVQLLWSAPPDLSVIGYHVYRSQAMNPAVRLTTTPEPSTSFRDTAVFEFEAYDYYVTAVSQAGGDFYESAPSTTVEDVIPGLLQVQLQGAAGGPGGLVEVTIGIENAVGLGGPGGSMDFTIFYDSAVLSVEEVKAAPALDGVFGALAVDDLNGTLSIGAQSTGGDPVRARGRLLNIVFRVAPGAVPNQVAVVSVQGCFLTGYLNGSLYTAQAELPPPINITVQSTHITGDVNGDGRVTNADAQAVLDFAVGTAAPTASELRAGDLNGDLALTEADVPLVLARVVGGGVIIPRAPVRQLSLTQYKLTLNPLQAVLIRNQDGKLELRVPLDMNRLGSEGSLKARLVFDTDLLQLQKLQNPAESSLVPLFQSYSETVQGKTASVTVAQGSSSLAAALGEQPPLLAVFEVQDEAALEFVIKLDEPRVGSDSGYDAIGSVPVRSSGAVIRGPGLNAALAGSLTGESPATSAGDSNGDRIQDAADLVSRGRPYPPLE